MTGTTGSQGPDAVAFARHDHAGCVAGALAAAEARCREDGARLTPVRRRVLEMLLTEHRALGAYEILDRLAREGMGSQPPVAYRALDFLVRHALAHRIERRNAFVACAHPGRDHVPAFMVCRLCAAVAEAWTGPARDALEAAAARVGFRVERTVIEAEGLCPSCQGAAPA